MMTPAEQASERNAEDDIALSRLWPFARAAVPYWIARAERAEAAIRKHHERHADAQNCSACEILRLHSERDRLRERLEAVVLMAEASELYDIASVAKGC
jgi:hypothetical protein